MSNEREKLPHSIRKHNRQVLSQARKSGDPQKIAQVEQQVAEVRNPQEMAWQNFERSLSQKVEGYPESFPPLAHQAIREFFNLRGRIEVSGAERTRLNSEFMAKYPDPVIDQITPVLTLITQSLVTRPAPKTR